MIKHVLYGLLLLSFSFSAKALKPDPAIRFSTFESQHFEIIFDREQKELAQRYLLAAEQAYDLLIPIFKEAPAKTYLILRDETDITNGMANFLPYPHIIVYPVLPSTLDSIDDYGDWTLEMMVHEYTHILNLYPAHGFYKPLTWVLGNVVRPNATLPSWYHEGLAVNLESRLTDHGRLRSTETAAAARALVSENKLRMEDIARINESQISTFPYGARPYLYGGWWWEHAHTENGSEVIYKWNQSFSRRIPFLIDGPMIEQTGKNAAGLLDAKFADLEKAAKAQKEKLNARPIHASESLLDGHDEQTIFAVSPSGQSLVYWLNTPGEGSRVMLKTRSSAGQSFKDIKGVPLFKNAGTQKVIWLDENTLLFDQLDIEHPYHTFRDLYSFEISSKQSKRLTTGLRAGEPAVSPSGNKIAFIQADAGKNNLALFNRQSGEITTLVAGQWNQRLSAPEFLNENEILFVLRNREGTEKIYLYNAQEKTTSPWLSSLANTQGLRKTAAGFLVTDASTQVRNAYLIDNNGKAKAVTNTLTDVIAADYDPQRKEIIFSELTAGGRRLQATPLKEFEPVALEPSKLPAAPEPPRLSLSFEEKDYQPLQYMWPRYWIPFIYQIENGFLFQGMTSGSDPAGRNSYSLFGSYETITNKGSYGLSYVNHSLPVDLGASYEKYQSYLGASDVTLESQEAMVSASTPLGNRWQNLTLNFAWENTSGYQKVNRMGPEIAYKYSRLAAPRAGKIGYQVDLSHTQYLKSGDYLAYGRTAANLLTQVNLGRNHKLAINARGALAPDMPFNRVIAIGDRSLGGNYLVNLAYSPFLLRGYPSGTFVGRKILNANIEYVLPAWELSRGFGTLPIFLRNLELAFFADALSVDGGAFEISSLRYRRSGLSEFYVGSGAELRLSTNAAYHLPVTFTFGLYYGANQRFGGGFSPFIGIGLGDF